MPAQPVLATTPLALHALTLHMLEKGLPAPYSIDTPLATSEDHLKVTVPGWELDQWVATIAVDDEHFEATGHASTRRRVDGRLPDYGIRVQITGIVSPGHTALLQRLTPGGVA